MCASLFHTQNIHRYYNIPLSVVRYRVSVLKKKFIYIYIYIYYVYCFLSHFEPIVESIHVRLPMCVMFGERVGGVGCVGGQKKERMRCFLDVLRAFGINADQWTTAAQDEGERRRMAEQGGERFMAKGIALLQETLGLDYRTQ